MDAVSENEVNADVDDVGNVETTGEDGDGAMSVSFAVSRRHFINPLAWRWAEVRNERGIQVQLSSGLLRNDDA